MATASEKEHQGPPPDPEFGDAIGEVAPSNVLDNTFTVYHQTPGSGEAPQGESQSVSVVDNSYTIYGQTPGTGEAYQGEDQAVAELDNSFDAYQK